MADSDSSETASSSRCSTPTKKLKIRGEIRQNRHKQVYRTEWEAKYTWLKAEKNSGKAKCIICKETFVSDLTVIKNHEKSKKHLKNSACVKDQPKIKTFVKSASDIQLENKISEAEIKLAAFLAEHNISFLTSDHLTELLKNIFPDSKIAQKMQLKRTKSACITSNVIARAHKEHLSEILKISKFSLLIDEATDISSCKTLCVAVRYFSNSDEKIVSKLWSLRQLSIEETENPEHGATAERLYKSVLESFQEFGVPFSNIIGFGSDGYGLNFSTFSWV